MGRGCEKIIPLRKVSKAAAKVLEAPYKLGSLDPAQGLDCISSIYVFYRELGVEIADHLEELNAGNYAQAWKDDPEKAKKAMARYLLTIGEEIDPNFAQAGDLLFMEQEGQTIYMIFLGQGNVLLSDSRFGTFILPRRSLSGKIRKVIRPKIIAERGIQ